MALIMAAELAATGSFEMSLFHTFEAGRSDTGTSWPERASRPQFATGVRVGLGGEPPPW